MDDILSPKEQFIRTTKVGEKFLSVTICKTEGNGTLLEISEAKDKENKTWRSERFRLHDSSNREVALALIAALQSTIDEPDQLFKMMPSTPKSF